jgi:hypothetical protein
VVRPRRRPLNHDERNVGRISEVATERRGGLCHSPKYRMQTSSCLYPMTLEEACDVANQIKLNPRQTYIEPSRFSGHLTDDNKAAVALRLTFNAKPWPTVSDDLHLMFVERSPEVLAWIGSCGYEFEPVEIVAVQFGSDEDQEKFEGVVWPHRATEGVKMC